MTKNLVLIKKFAQTIAFVGTTELIMAKIKQSNLILYGLNIEH